MLPGRAGILLGAGLPEKLLIIPVEPRRFVLFDRDGFPQLALFNVHLMQLRLVLALILITLFLCCIAVVLERPLGLNMFFFQRLDVFVLFSNLSAQSRALACSTSSGWYPMLANTHGDCLSTLGFITDNTALVTQEVVLITPGPL